MSSEARTSCPNGLIGLSFLLLFVSRTRTRSSFSRQAAFFFYALPAAHSSYVDPPFRARLRPSSMLSRLLTRPMLLEDRWKGCGNKSTLWKRGNIQSLWMTGNSDNLRIGRDNSPVFVLTVATRTRPSGPGWTFNTRPMGHDAIGWLSSISRTS